MLVAGETCGENMHSLLSQYHINSKKNFPNIKVPKYGITWTLNMFREGLGPNYVSQLIPANKRLYNCSWVGAYTFRAHREMMANEFQQDCKIILQKKFLGNMSALQYRSMMCDSIFALAPWGANPETIRLADALECGAIPITLHTKYIDKLPGPVPWIIANSWTDAHRLMLESLKKGPKYLQQLQVQNILWWKKYLKCARKHISAILSMAYLNVDI